MRNTRQKNLVYKVVMESFDHPTAETIYGRAKKELPQISLGTVYRNLAILANNGKIKRISVPTGDRFDKTLKNHSHFFCKKCNKVYDLDFDHVQDLISYTADTCGCKIDKVDILFAGICKDCNK